MSDQISRRSLLHHASVGAVAAGALTVGGLGAVTVGRREADMAGPLLDGSGVIAHVVDARAGTISILVGTRAITYTDVALAQQLMRAAR